MRKLQHSKFQNCWWTQLVKIKGWRKEYPQVQIQVFGLQSLGSGQGDWLSQWALLVRCRIGNSIKTAFWWREVILKNYWSLIKVLVVQLCLTLHDPVDFGPPGSSLRGIFQAWMLEWVAIPFPRDIPSPGIKARGPALQVDSLPSEPPGVSHCLKLNTPGSWESVYQSSHCFFLEQKKKIQWMSLHSCSPELCEENRRHFLLPKTRASGLPPVQQHWHPVAKSALPGPPWIRPRCPGGRSTSSLTTLEGGAKNRMVEKEPTTGLGRLPVESIRRHILLQVTNCEASLWHGRIENYTFSTYFLYFTI